MGVESRRTVFFFLLVWSKRRGVKWSGHCSYICLGASLSPYLCFCTLCAKIQSIATPAVERGEGQQLYWSSQARQTQGDTENMGNTPQAVVVSTGQNRVRLGNTDSSCINKTYYDLCVPRTHNTVKCSN